MDNVSKLLREAIPAYHNRKRHRRMVSATMCSLLVGLWLGGEMMSQTAVFDDDAFDEYYTALYITDDVAGSDIVNDEFLPLDEYGLYEVV